MTGWSKSESLGLKVVRVVDQKGITHWAPHCKLGNMATPANPLAYTEIQEIVTR
jgi:hypothetical protein